MDNGGVTFAKYFIFRGVFLAASAINLGPFQERSELANHWAADAKEMCTIFVLRWCNIWCSGLQ